MSAVTVRQMIAGGMNDDGIASVTGLPVSGIADLRARYAQEVTPAAIAWRRVLDALLIEKQAELNRERVWNVDAPERASIGLDDEGMRDATQEELFDWIEDLDARCGYDVAVMRDRMIDFCEARDGGVTA